MASKRYLTAIHTAKSSLKLSDEDYRALLSSYNVESSKSLSDTDAIKLLKKLNKLGFSKNSEKQELPIQLEQFGERDKKFASQKQLNMLAGIWVSKAREKNVDSFNSFICRIAKVEHYTWLLKVDVQRVKKAIESLN